MEEGEEDDGVGRRVRRRKRKNRRRKKRRKGRRVERRKRRRRRRRRKRRRRKRGKRKRKRKRRRRRKGMRRRKEIYIIIYSRIEKCELHRTWISVLFDGYNSFDKLFHFIWRQEVTNVMLPLGCFCKLLGFSCVCEREKSKQKEGKN